MDRWNTIKQLCQAALDKPAAERAAFLDDACAGDDSLRQEVQSLLAQERDAERFLEAPAFEVAARAVAHHPRESLVGRTLGHYRVLSRLGAGGMGEVFLAEDTRLERHVALKVLPADVASDPDRMARFTREAKAASALNHSNVATIHDIGEVERISFITMEYVEGQTLAERIDCGPMTPAEVVQIGAQVADALDAAHAKRIIHRDIKSANLMVTPRGQVKVLDFGLAKLAAPETPAASQDTRSAATMPGMVMGTVDYMSPEQVLGRDVDHRSDLFSLGVVLYELVTGRLPFTGRTAGERMDRIVHAEPAPIAPVDETAAGLQRLVRKCLEKDRERRYQSARELLVDLKNLQRDSGSTTPVLSSARRRAWRLSALVLLVAVLLVASYFVVARRSQVETVRAPAAVAVPLTAYPGYERVPSLSPDGSQVAFTWDGPDEKNRDIYVKLVGPGEPLQITSDPLWEDSPAWSTDGSLIAFQRSESASIGVFVVPALGGAERQVATIESLGAQPRPRGNLAWSPDGKWIAVGGRPSGEKSVGIWLIALDGSERRRLTEVGAFDAGHTTPAFSPDGRHLAFIRALKNASNAVYVLPLSPALQPGGRPTSLTSEFWNIQGLAWTSDGSGLVFSAGGHVGISRLRRIAFRPERSEPLPHPELLPFGEGATAVTISRSGGRLVYSMQTRDSAFWKISLTPSQNPQQPTLIASSTYDEHTPDYSPDGKRLAFASTRSGEEEIWIANADGSKPVPVTSMQGPLCANPRWSPDGNTIVFSSRREGSGDLYLLTLSTGQFRRITDHPTEDVEPRWSRDGQWIYFGSDRSGRPEVWKVPAAGGTAIRVTQQGGSTATESPDGRYLYYAKNWSVPNSIWRVPVDGGEEKLVVEGLSLSLNFVVADRGLYFLAVGGASPTTSIDFFEYATGKRTTLFSVGKRPGLGMALAPDQQSLLYSVVDSLGGNLMFVDRFQ